MALAEPDRHLVQYAGPRWTCTERRASRPRPASAPGFRRRAALASPAGERETAAAPAWRGLLQREWVAGGMLAVALTLLFQVGVPFRGRSAPGSRATSRSTC